MLIHGIGSPVAVWQPVIDRLAGRARRDRARPAGLRRVAAAARRGAEHARTLTRPVAALRRRARRRAPACRRQLARRRDRVRARARRAAARRSARSRRPASPRAGGALCAHVAAHPRALARALAPSPAGSPAARGAAHHARGSGSAHPERVPPDAMAASVAQPRPLPRLPRRRCARSRRWSALAAGPPIAPTTIAWGEHDSAAAHRPQSARARAALPGGPARHADRLRARPDVDDPEQVRRVLLNASAPYQPRRGAGRRLSRRGVRRPAARPQLLRHPPHDRGREGAPPAERSPELRASRARPQPSPPAHASATRFAPRPRTRAVASPPRHTTTGRGLGT